MAGPLKKIDFFAASTKFADPDGVDPDPTFKKKRSGPGSGRQEKKPDTDPT